MLTAAQQVLTNQDLLDLIVYDAVTVTPRFDDDALVWKRRKANRVSIGRVNRAFARAVEAALYHYGEFHACGLLLKTFGRRVVGAGQRARLVRDIEISNLPTVPPAVRGDVAVVARITAVLSRLGGLQTLRFDESPPSAILTVVDVLVALAAVPSLRRIVISSGAIFEQSGDLARLWRCFTYVPGLRALSLLSQLGEALVPGDTGLLYPLSHVTALEITIAAWPPDNHPAVQALLPNLRVLVVRQVDGLGHTRRLLEGCPETLTTIRLEDPQEDPDTFPANSQVAATISRFPSVTTVAVTSALLPHACLVDLPPSIERVDVFDASADLYPAVRTLLSRPSLRQIRLDLVPGHLLWADTDELLPLRVSHALETVGNIDQFSELTHPQDISLYGITRVALLELIRDAAESGVVLCGSLVKLLTSHERYEQVLMDAVMSWAVSNGREDIAVSVYGGTREGRESMDAWRRHHGV